MDADQADGAAVEQPVCGLGKGDAVRRVVWLAPFERVDTCVARRQEPPRVEQLSRHAMGAFLSNPRQMHADRNSRLSRRQDRNGTHCLAR